jgi:DNA-binding beta-propeller fold protein YncE
MTNFSKGAIGLRSGVLPALLAVVLATNDAGISARQSEINGPADLAYVETDTLLIVEQVGKRLTLLELDRNTVRRINTGSGSSYAHSIAGDHKGGLYVADFDGGLQHLDLATGRRDVLISATDGSLKEIDSMVVDDRGSLYLSQGRNHEVLLWNPSSRRFSVLAGTGKSGFGGDGGPAGAASLSFPRGLALTPKGDLLVADAGNCRIRKIDLTSGVITTVAGTGPIPFTRHDCEFSGDGGLALEAQLNPKRIAVNKNGTIFVVTAGYRVRQIDPATQLITTLAGTGEKKSSGDGGPASRASLASPSGIAIDAGGNIYISEYVGNRFRRIDAATGTITTVAGNGKPLRGDLIL